MSNDYFNATGIPGQASFGSSAAIRALMSSVASGFDKLPILTGNALKLVRVNASATGLETLSSLDNAPIGQGGAAQIHEQFLRLGWAICSSAFRIWGRRG